MSNINYIFFDEFKKLEKLCNEMYNAHNGATQYIDDMIATAHINCRNIPNWEADLEQLKRLRHIRNTLAHEEGAFNEVTCTTSDIEWIRDFCKRIMNQSDPLALQYQLRKNQTQRKATNVSFNKQNNTTITDNRTQHTIVFHDTDFTYTTSHKNNGLAITMCIILFIILGIFIAKLML